MFGALHLTLLHVSYKYYYYYHTTIIFGIPKDSSLKISILPLYSYTNVLQNVVKALSGMVFKNLFFCQKAQNFVHFGPHNLVNFASTCSRPIYISNNVWRDFLTSEFQHMHGRFLMPRETASAKIDFPIVHFMCYHYKRWHWKSKVSPYIVW